MSKQEELELFLLRTDELIESNYILADIKIVNLLKSIASSETLLALFKNCLTDFDYEQATEKYFVKSKYLSQEKAEYVSPSSSRELLALCFNVLMDIDSKKIDFGDFINKYFYEEGSVSLGYQAFVNAMIKPFRNSVKVLMESVIEGKLQDPIEALTEEEARRAREAEENKRREIKEKELSGKVYAESMKKTKELLVADKKKVKGKEYKDTEDLVLIIDMLANALESGDKDAIVYAFTAYKYAAASHKLCFYKKVKTLNGYMKDILNGL